MKKNILLNLLLLLPFVVFSQVIVIDPGHGYGPNGEDKDGRTKIEITTNCEVGLRTRALLQSDGYTVHMTRTHSGNGSWVSVSQRATMADNWGAKRLLSIHCNGGGGTGTETFYCVRNTANVNVDIAWAKKVQAKMVQYGEWKDRRCEEDNSYLHFHLGVLSGYATGCLNEIGFVDYTSDKNKLVNNGWRDKFAKAYQIAIRENIPRPVSGPTNLSATLANCPSGNVTFKWNNSGTGWQINVSTSSTFDKYYLKWVSGKTSYTGPDGFIHNSTSAPLASFKEGTKYYWRIYDGKNYTATKSFTTNLCKSSNEITENLFEKGFKVYPNPTTGSLNLSFENIQEKLQVNIRNTAGILIKQETATNTRFINMEIEAVKGIYFVEIISKQGASIAKVVVL